MEKRVALIILDGWGIGPIWGGNAIALANTPNFDHLVQSYPNTALFASGEDVGLPYGEPGNSEVGHLNIGAGQKASQGLSAINQMIENGTFFTNPALCDVMDRVKEKKTSLHLMGLVSDGGIHAHIDHLAVLLEMAKQKGIVDVFIHFFSDGRDTTVTSGIKFLKQTQDKIDEIGLGKIASVSGRYFAMDRDNNWDRIEKAYDVILGLTSNKSKSARDVFLHSYSKGITDEFIVPVKIDKSRGIENGDGIIFFNYRSDRARQLSSALVLKEFSGFKRKKVLEDIVLATFGSYQESLPISVAFQSTQVSDPLAKELEKHNLSHFHIAETEKYAHVTYFFNGGNEQPYPREKRLVVPSQKVKTFDMKPEMRAIEIADHIIDLAPDYNFTVANFANADMVGHTGNFEAAVKAVEAVDKALGRIMKKFYLSDIPFLVTADHGNAEEMIDQATGLANTEHTKNPVPFIFASKKSKGVKLVHDGRLSDISPTIIDLFGVNKPSSMKGKSLIKG